MSEKSLEQRIKLLEDIEAIRRLTATYAHYIDRGRDDVTVPTDGLANLFTEDASWYSSATNEKTVGRAQIADMLPKASAPYEFAMHSFSNPVIDVDGDTATGQWLLWVGIKRDGATNEVFQSENLTYTRTPAGWLIQSIDLRFGAMLLT